MDPKLKEKKMKKAKRKAETFAAEGSPPKKRRDEVESPTQSIERRKASKAQVEVEDSPKVLKSSKRNKRQDAKENEEVVEDSRHQKILSKYQKATKPGLEQQTQVTVEITVEKTEELHGIAPLPRPEQLEEGPYRPEFSTLPKSFQRPLVTASSRRVSFRDLPISQDLVSVLESRGYEEAFAVQAAVLPLLLPGHDRHDGDICVSASTGSGKTLAYVLPLVDSMRDRALTALRGIVVVPTRELAAQVAEVCRMCATGTRLNIEVALGNRPLNVERDLLVGRKERCDPVAFQDLWQNETERLDQEMWDNFDEFRRTYLKQDTVYDFYSKVDILICTPGRLVEHLNSTKGFSLAHLEWLVVDEADRLLDQNFQSWLKVVLGSIEHVNGKLLGDLVKTLPRSQTFSLPPRKIRKVVLSATLTRDAGKIQSLDLDNAKLVVVSDDGMVNELSGLHSEKQAGERENIYNLPILLQEHAVSVGDGAYKPLYLFKLLKEYVFWEAISGKKITVEEQTSDTDMSFNSSSDSSSDSDSSSSSDSDDSSSDSSSAYSDSDSDSSESSLSSSSSETPSVTDVAMKDAPVHNEPARPHSTGEPAKVLIFTRSNESTLRLSRLLELLDPTYSSQIGVLTSSVRRSQRKSTLKQFLRGNLSVLIASDLVSRGLDLPHLSHVINYDPPTSVTEYVHRCGRTARAGNPGAAFTLLANREARWFWNNIARAEEIRRPDGAHVGRIAIELDEETETGALEEALKVLEAEVKSR